jgi:coenzyme F420-reducing hydrogenase gamma subunit
MELEPLVMHGRKAINPVTTYCKAKCNTNAATVLEPATAKNSAKKTVLFFQLLK